MILSFSKMRKIPQLINVFSCLNKNKNQLLIIKVNKTVTYSGKGCVHHTLSEGWGTGVSKTNLVLSASEITANLYCNRVYLYWEGCAICSIYLR